MKLLIDTDALAALKARDRVPVECAVCGQTFHAPKNTVLTVLKGSSQHTLDCCSRACAAIYVNRNAPAITCDQCGRIVKRHPSDLRKGERHFCSKACAMRFRNSHNLVGNTCKSQAETYLAELIRADYPGLVVEQNVRNLLPSGLEVDLLIRSHNLAIELNGPIHYVPIFGDEKLAAVQSADQRKQAEIHSLGIRLIVVDISPFHQGSRTTRFLDRYYPTHIKPLLSG
jgi:hypothetical protein